MNKIDYESIKESPSYVLDNLSRNEDNYQVLKAISEAPLALPETLARIALADIEESYDRNTFSGERFC